jgi:alcohol dehydrogenase, propanol-preferring
MKALQYRDIGGRPEIVSVADPSPGPGQVLLQVTAAGACHSDEFLMGLPAEHFRYGLPLTLGHEGCGIVAQLGQGVTGVAVGDAVAVYGAWGCGYCHLCAQGKENYCTNADALDIRPPGLGAPGAMAEFMLVDSPRHLVPLGGLDPITNVSLTDAGLTPYHAIKSAMTALMPGSTAVVIGTGGLGHVAIQILRAITSATVIALDVNEAKLELARDVGAHHVLLSDDHAVGAIRDLTGGLGADAIFDFVSAPSTTTIAAASAAVEAEIRVVGIGAGVVPVGFHTTAWNVGVRAPYWGSRSELIEVFDLARAGLITVEVETYSLDDAPKAYQRLHDGQVRGRAVIVPDQP